MITTANAGRYPWAMMIKSNDASITNLAMLRSQWLHDTTRDTNEIGVAALETLLVCEVIR